MAANKLPEVKAQKLRIVRVVTASYVVPWHLHNTLLRLPSDFEVCVAGQEVSKNQLTYPDVKFVDIDISRKISLLSDIRALFTLCRLLLVYKPDIIHSIMPKAGLFAAVSGIISRVPIRIHTFTGQVWVAKSGIGRYFYYWLDRLVNALNTVCLTDSFSQSHFLFEHKISHCNKPLPVLLQGSLSGVDLTRFDRVKLEKQAQHLKVEMELEDNVFVFAFIARKTREKGALDILRAFSDLVEKFDNARLLFIGPDEDGLISQLHNEKPKLFRNVIELGLVSNPEEYLAISDVLCLPSYREGFGSIVIDAAAMGVPTIGTKIPGLIDAMVDGHTGFLVPSGDREALVDKMQWLIKNPHQAREMGENAKVRVEQSFSADLLYEALRKFYFDCAQNNSVVSKKYGVAHENID